MEDRKFQVTLTNSEGKYRAVSTIVTMPGGVCAKLDSEKLKARVKSKGIMNICAKRCWTASDIRKYGFDKMKMREVTHNPTYGAK